MKIEILTPKCHAEVPKLARLHLDNGESSLVLVPGGPGEVTPGSVPFRTLGDTFPVVSGDPDDHIWGGGYPLVSPAMIPALIQDLEAGEAYPRFVVLMFQPANTEDGEYVNLQYSWEDGRVGLDWVLLGGRNIADMGLVEALAEHLGHQVMRLEMNEVKFLRFEGPGIADLGMAILHEVYGIEASDSVELLTEGI
jgi:hypothetical protein